MNFLVKKNYESLENIIWLACEKDPWFFIRNFCITEDPDNLEQPMQLFPDKAYAEIFVREWERNNVLCVVKSRQILVTWLSLCLTLWRCMFIGSQWCFYQAKNEDDVEHHIYRTNTLYNNLPRWMKQMCRRVKSTSLNITFSNRSMIDGMPVAGGEKIRSKSVSHLLLDEFAFMMDAEKTLKSSIAATGKHGKILIVSTPNISYYYDVVHDTASGRECNLWTPVKRGVRVRTNPGNKYRILEIHYKSDPDKDPETGIGQQWVRMMREKFPDQQTWEREFELNWHAQDGKVFYQEFHRGYVKRIEPNPNLPIYRSWDFGYHAPACVWFQVDESIWVDGCPLVRVLRSVTGKDTTIERFAREVVLPVYSDLKGSDGKRIRIYDCCDQAGTQKNDKSEKSSIETLQTLRDKNNRPYYLTFRYRKIGIRPRCDMLRRVIQAGQLLVDEQNARDVELGLLGGIIFPKYKPGITKEQAEIPDTMSPFIHCNDALGYGVVNFVRFDLDRVDTSKGRHKASIFIGPGNRRR